VSNVDTVWAATSADSEFEETVQPPAGWMGLASVVGARAGVSKKGETYLAVDLKSQDGQYNWPIYKQLTTNGVVQEGRVKSAKITLRQLGVDPNAPFAQVESLLKAKVGHWYSVEQKASDRINNTTGLPYVNTEILGVSSAPAPATDGSAYVQPQNVVATFPPAVPGTAPTVVAPQGNTGGVPEAQQNVAGAQQNLDPVPF
jgi:hypothetical protein